LICVVRNLFPFGGANWEICFADDGDFIKTVLTRLTGRSTFPNAILLGKSIGGSNELAMMHEDRRLRQLFEDAGLKVRSELNDDDA
jgi:glutaredoxin 3